MALSSYAPTTRTIPKRDLRVSARHYAVRGSDFLRRGLYNGPTRVTNPHRAGFSANPIRVNRSFISGNFFRVAGFLIVVYQVGDFSPFSPTAETNNIDTQPRPSGNPFSHSEMIFFDWSTVLAFPLRDAKKQCSANSQSGRCSS
jgi:hypothetical protein